ncbi:MAG: hypothetical protein IJ252_13835 [Solobacterium sp.]|nr:hypothetical protein [Solobacterium sp.]
MKNSFRIRLAEQVIEIYSDGQYMKSMCKKYLTEGGDPAFSVDVNQYDIDFEIDKHLERNQTAAIRAGRMEVFESLAVYRKIAEAMIDYDTLLFHGSAIAVDGICYMFCAESGTGKSTHTRLWREYFGDRAVMINDDKPLVQIRDEVRIFGTPWSGKHHLDKNDSAPLKAVVFLHRGETNRIEPISREKALPELLRYSYHSNDPVRLQRSIGLLVKLMDTVSLYSLHCNMEPEAAQICYNGINNINKDSDCDE